MCSDNFIIFQYICYTDLFHHLLCIARIYTSFSNVVVNVCIYKVFGILTTKSLEIIEIIHFRAKRKGEIKLPTSPN